MEIRPLDREIYAGKTFTACYRTDVYKRQHEGYTDIFLDAGCIVSTPTCGPCLGGYMGTVSYTHLCFVRVVPR